MSQSYSVGASTFENFVWLGNGALFKNPTFLEIELISIEAFGVEIVRKDGTLAGKAQRPNMHGGWSTFHFREGGEFNGDISNGDYKIKVTNLGTGNRQVKAGRLEYDV